MLKIVYLIFNVNYYKGLILKPVLTPDLNAAHHVNGHLPSLETNNIFSDENDFYKLTNKLTEKRGFILYMGFSFGTNRYT